MSSSRYYRPGHRHPVHPLARRLFGLITALLALLVAAPLALLGPAPTAYAAGDLTVKVYNDAGRDGVDTGGAETGLNGISVALYSIDDLLVGLVNTNAGGIASFPNLADGDYRIEVTPPANYVVSVPGSNTNPGLVSFVQISGAAASVRVGLRQLSGVGGTDAGAPPASRNITTRVWDDLDADGVQDAGEPGLGGLSLELVDNSNTVIRTSVPVTGALGRYTFGDVPSGVAYNIRVQSAPAGYALTRQDASSFDGRDSDGVLATFPPAAASVPIGGRGVNTDSVDIGFARGAVSGFVWRDIDADGSYDIASEPRINGVTVQLINDSTNAVIATIPTRAEIGDGGLDGVYRFTGLALGSYRVRIPATQFQAGALLFGSATPPNVDDRGLVNGTTAAGVPGPADFVETAAVTLDATNVGGGSNVSTSSLFGFYKGAVGDFVWFDANRDSLQAGETTLGQNGLLVFVDDGRGGGTPNNGVRDGGELSTVTENHPNTGLPGYYLFDDLPLGPSYRIVLDSSNFAVGASLEGIGSSTATQATTAGGATYYYIDTPALTSAAPTFFNADFGLVRSDVGNFVFIDNNGNGLFDEPASAVVPGVTVRLVRNSDSSVIATTTSGATGLYTITNVPAVPYYVTFDVSTAAAPLNTAVASPQPAGVTIDPRETTFANYSDLVSSVNATTWRTAVFTPAVGLQNLGVDAGFYQLTTLSGRAFFDSNNDGQDNAPPEPGMRSLTVRLRRAADLSLVSTTTTAADDTGAYTFTNVVPGSYVVDVVNPDATNYTFILADVPSAGDPLASDVDNTGRTATVAVTSGTPATDVDAGLTGRALVSGRVFLDSDGSSTQNTGDSNLIGATATLTVAVNLPNLVVTYNPANATAAPTADNDPNYAFPNLPGGTGVSYTLAFSPPAASPAYVASAADQGGSDSLDSDGPSVTVNNPPAGATLDFDQGYYQNVTITARVFEESSGAAINNQYAVGDSGLANVTVALETSTGTPVSSGTTGATGLVTFTVAPGNYRLNIDQTDADLAGLLTSPGHTDPVAVSGTPLTSGQTSATDTAGANSFGYYRGATLTGRVFFDRNLDNLQAGEPGLQGVNVTVTGPSTPGVVTTDATGAYTVTGLLPGNYTVTFQNPDTANFAFVAAGDSNVILGGAFPTSSTGSVTVGYNATVSSGANAGLIGRSTVNGYTFVDSDANGIQGGSDTALSSVTVTLTQTVNISGRLSTTIVRTASSDGGGNYSFSALPGGTGTSFDLSFTPPSATPAYQVTLADQGADNNSDSDGAAELTGQTVGKTLTVERDQGYYQPVTITARVFQENGGGTIDNQYAAGDGGIANVTVSLEPNGGGTAVATSTTNATGVVTFTVAPGDYQLNVDQTDADLAGLLTSPGHTDPVAVFGTPLTGGQSSLTDTTGRNSFGYYRASTLRGRVFFDRNVDTLLTGEPGVQGVNVTVTGPSTPGVVTTDATGAYTVTGLLPGNYTVTFQNPDLSNFAFIAGGDSDLTIPGANPTGSTGSVTLGYNSTVSGDSDAGLIGRGTVSGNTFVDGDYNGLQGDAADTVLNGATANLTVNVNIPNRLVTTITRSATTAAGAYSFASLPGGASVTYSLTFTPPTATPAYLATLADQGADNTIDSDGAAELTNQTLASGATQDRDQGFYQPVTITARVFDENSGPIDNQYAVGNPGLANVTVTLEPNGGGTAVGTGTTNATGLVTFTVAPGNYQLNIDQADADLAGLTASPGHTDPVAVFGTPLTSGQTSLTDTTGRNSFGYYRTSSVSGRVFFDRNLDNLKLSEPGLQSLTVNLRDSTGTTVLTNTTTSATGVYTFTTLPAGSYIVEFVNPDAANFTFITAGDSDVTNAATGRTGALTVPYGTNVTNVDAGAIGLATVSGNTFVDGNYNGLQGDAADAALNGATANLTVDVAIDGLLSTTITRSATTAAGAYSFAGLPGDVDGLVTYDLTFTPPTATPAYQATLADQGADNTIDSDGAAELTDQTLDPGDTQDRDQGYYQPVTISARVFQDTTLPLNNQWNNSEGGIANVSVALETNPAGTAVATQTTNANGLVTFSVPPGDYRLNVDQADADLAGFTASPGNTEPTPVAGTPLTSGQSSITQAAPVGTTNVFGYYRPGTVTGSAFFDGRTAAPDNQRAGEPGMSGVTVRLLDNSLAVVSTTTTLATGVYTFTDVVPGAYTVEFVNPDATNFVYSTTVAGDNNVSALSGNNGRTAQFQVTSGSTQTRNAATFGRGSITGTAFVDGTADGRQGGTADTTLNGVTVDLTLNVALPNLTTTITRSAPTAGAGAYSFIRLPGGAALAQASFSLAFTPPAATPPWTLTAADAAPDDAGDSDSELTNQLLSPNSTLDRDQGYYQNVTITARVFDEQVTVDNTFQTGEVGLAGVTVDLTGTTSASGATVASTGLVTFTVQPGTYTLTVPTDPATFTRSPGNTGTAAVGTLNSGAAATTALFGYYRVSTFDGSAWFDSDGDGSFDVGEPGMEGITVSLVGNNSGELISDTTTLAGGYSFVDVAPTGGSFADTGYRVCFSLPASFAYTTKGADLLTDGNSDVDESGANLGCSDSFTLGSNNNVTAIDAGYIGTLSIGDLVWNDLDADGLQDTGEPGLGGVTVTLAISTTGGVINSSNPTLTITTTSTSSTNLAANYQLTRVPPSSGFEVVSLEAPFSYIASPADQGGDDARDSDPPGDYPTALPPVISDLDFGFYQTAAVGDRVWLDRNGNGTFEAGADLGVPGVRVQLLDAATSAVVASTTTAASGDIGFYQFLNIEPGSYVVEFFAPAGTVFVNDGLGQIGTDNDNDAGLNGRTESFAVISGQAVGGVDAGVRGTGSISGISWRDENSNNIRDAAETARLAGLGVTLTLTPTGWLAPITASATTAADGSYSFASLPAGSYAVRFGSLAGFSFVTPNAGSDEAVDSDAPLATGSLPAGAALANVDAGLRGLAGISGLVWADRDENGVREPRDTARLAGVRVTLVLTPTGGLPAISREATTAADGSYSFANLPAGSARVTFVTPDGYLPLPANVGGDDTVDSDGPVVNLAVGAGATLANVDMGYRPELYRAFLPQVFGPPPAPDLEVSFTVNPTTVQAGRPASITVTVRNTGSAPASNFWVDLYINPTSEPPQVNQPWNELCQLEPCFGIAWYYAGTLQPGESVVLNGNGEASAANPGGYNGGSSSWAGYFANGTSKIFVLVDSWNRNDTGTVRDPRGAVYELDETNNLAQQNITVTPGELPTPDTRRIQAPTELRARSLER